MSQRLSVRTAQSAIQQPLAPRQPLQHQCDCGRAKGPSGQCAECARKRPSIQTKLSINRPGDRYEQEADQMADRVMCMPAVDRSGESFVGIQPQLQERSKPANDERIAAKLNDPSPGLTPALGHQPRDLDGGRPLTDPENRSSEYNHSFRSGRSRQMMSESPPNLMTHHLG